MFISDLPGTGKTSLLTEILNGDLKDNDEYFLKFSINCLSINSINSFYEAIFKHLNGPVFNNFFHRIYKEKKQKEIINIIKQNPWERSFQKLLNILNYIYNIIRWNWFFNRKKNDFFFFSLITIPYLVKSNIKMILISNNSDFDKEIFPKLKNRKITIQKIVFKPYTHKQLTDIMTLKMEDIGLSKYFSTDAIRFLSTKMNRTGDIRPIKNIIKEIILNNKNKIENKVKFKIEIKDMFNIIKRKNVTLNEILNSLTIKQKIAVSAIYNVCKNNGIKFKEKILFEKYKNIKSFMNNRNFKKFYWYWTILLDKLHDSHKQKIGLLKKCLKILNLLLDIFSNTLIETTSVYGKSKKNMNLIYKSKYFEEDLFLIFENPIIFSLFNSNENVEDKKIDSDNDEKI